MSKPFRTRLVLLFALLLICSAGQAQQDSLTQKGLSRADQDVLNAQGLGNNLIFGGGVTLSNPKLDLKVDPEKAYLDPEFKAASITLIGGITQNVDARLQLVDQVVEVMYEGKARQIHPNQFAVMITEDGRRFESLQRPLKSKYPKSVVEIVAQYDEFKLCVHRQSNWRKPAHQKTPYDNDNYVESLYLQTTTYFISPSISQPVKNMKKLIAMLPAMDRQRAQVYAKRQGLRNRDEDYVTLFQYLAGGEG